MATKAGSSVFVGNIAFSFAEEQLIKIFESVGRVLKFRLITDKDTGRSKGFGFLDFADPDAAESAIRTSSISISKGQATDRTQATWTAMRLLDESCAWHGQVVTTQKTICNHQWTTRLLLQQHFLQCHQASTSLRI
jgi:RNA recognition motif-containing protein